MVLPSTSVTIGLLHVAPLAGAALELFALPLVMVVLTAFTLTLNSASTASLICGLVASSPPRTPPRRARRQGRLLGDDRLADQVVVARSSCFLAHFSRASIASTRPWSGPACRDAGCHRRSAPIARQHVDTVDVAGGEARSSRRPQRQSMTRAASSRALIACASRALVLPSSNAALSMTTRSPAVALADRACLGQRAELLGQICAWLRGSGPCRCRRWRNWGALREP